MQTFLPYPDFIESAKCLDMKRLGKQRVECLQLLKALKQGPTFYDATYRFGCVPLKTPWYNHPACRMWKGYEKALVEYGFAICQEWKNRGYKDTCMEKILLFSDEKDTVYPSWLGNEDFHVSHKSNLIRKFPEHYKKFWPDVSDNLPYVWPIK